MFVRLRSRILLHRTTLRLGFTFAAHRLFVCLRLRLRFRFIPFPVSRLLLLRLRVLVCYGFCLPLPVDCRAIRCSCVTDCWLLHTLRLIYAVTFTVTRYTRYTHRFAFWRLIPLRLLILVAQLRLFTPQLDVDYVTFVAFGLRLPFTILVLRFDCVYASYRYPFVYVLDSRVYYTVYGTPRCSSGWFITRFTAHCTERLIFHAPRVACVPLRTALRCTLLFTFGLVLQLIFSDLLRLRLPAVTQLIITVVGCPFVCSGYVYTRYRCLHVDCGSFCVTALLRFALLRCFTRLRYTRLRCPFTGWFRLRDFTFSFARWLFTADAHHVYRLRCWLIFVVTHCGYLHALPAAAFTVVCCVCYICYTRFTRSLLLFPCCVTFDCSLILRSAMRLPFYAFCSRLHYITCVVVTVVHRTFVLLRSAHVGYYVCSVTRSPFTFVGYPVTVSQLITVTTLNVVDFRVLRLRSFDC